MSNIGCIGDGVAPMRALESMADVDSGATVPQ